MSELHPVEFEKRIGINIDNLLLRFQELEMRLGILEWRNTTKNIKEIHPRCSCCCHQGVLSR